ncbi:glycolipid 2-alpha-mannosyltransferase-domain-containing protein [Phycomyces nitens]|nr:glycolipid 2-alpha-mannosyltransferase-domain-containing protein [Phycomyces nitens]
MLHQTSDGPHSPKSPLKKPLSRRTYSRTLAKLSILALVSIFLLAYGRSLIWPKTDLPLDPKDVNILQSLCNLRPDKPKIHETKPITQEYTSTRHLLPETVPDTFIPTDTWKDLPTKGVLYMIIHNNKLQSARESIRSIEDRFNHKYRYPWVLLNSQHFTSDFRKYASMATKAPVYFGKIDSDSWSYPAFIDVERAERNMGILGGSTLYKGGSLSFRQAARYQTGLFFHHPLFKDAEYVWRVEADSQYTCDMVEFDPFKDMKDHNKTIGFALTTRDSPKAIHGLWKVTRAFIDDYAKVIVSPDESIMPWIVDGHGEYNTCHMVSSFEVVDLAFYRSPVYQKYFEYLDRSGGFFYGRWGDAPVRSIAAAMFLKRNQIHYFNNVGYSYGMLSHCPFQDTYSKHCSCSLEDTFDFKENSCTIDLLRLVNRTVIYEMADYAKLVVDKTQNIRKRL